MWGRGRSKGDVSERETVDPLDSLEGATKGEVRVLQ